MLFPLHLLMFAVLQSWIAALFMMSFSQKIGGLQLPLAILIISVSSGMDSYQPQHKPHLGTAQVAHTFAAKTSVKWLLGLVA